MDGARATFEEALRQAQRELGDELDALLAALGEEHAALAAGAREALDAAGARKSAALARIGNLQHELDHLARQLLRPRGGLTPALLARLRRAQQHNERNGALVQARMHYIGLALQALGAAQPTPLYGRDGRSHAGSAQGIARSA